MNTNTKNEDKQKSSGKEPVKHSREFFEQEAKTDFENLLASSIKNHSFGKAEDLKPYNENAPRSNKLMQRIDAILKQPKSKNINKKSLRNSTQINDDNFKPLKNSIENTSNLRFDSQFMNKVALPNDGTIKSRISGGHNVNSMLRNHVNYVNIKPEVYPLLITDNKYGSREIASEKDIVQITHQYLTKDDDELHKLVNQIDTQKNNETFTRTATLPMSDNFNLEGLLNKLHIVREEAIPTRKEPDTDVMLHDFLNKFYARSTNPLVPSNRVKVFSNNFDELDNKDSLHRILLRSDAINNVNSNANERSDKFMKYMNTENYVRTPRYTLSYIERPARYGDQRSRNRRSSGTQAGYTQDPDTCKTYNENLVKLWSNLSKLINIKEQPSDRALHNIAMMIQAYLEHQNAKQPPETITVRHEGPRNKVREILLRIRKLLDEAEGSGEKITKIILKYLKPDYIEVESEDCQQVNEESLTLSVDLLYKNYLEKTDCQGEDVSIARNKRVVLRQSRVKTGKPDIGPLTLSLVNSDLKPDFQNLLIENESYTDSFKGNTPRKRPPAKNRRVFKPSMQQRSRSAYRSGNENESENLNTRSKSSSKSTSKKHKKNSLKTDVEKNRCKKYATRKLIVSLRPVIERFMGLLECQLDNTLRSDSFSRDSDNSNHLYTSKYYSNEDNRRHRKFSHRFPERNTGRKRNKSPEKSHTKRYYNSFENYEDASARDHDDETDSTWVRKYSFDKTKSMNSEAHAKVRDKNARVSDIDKNTYYSNNDYETSYNEYFQSPSAYDDYDGVYKAHQNAFPGLINPSISLNDNKNSPCKSRNKKVDSSDKVENYNNYEYETYYRDSSISEEANDEYFVKQQTANCTKTPFKDLTKLRSEDQLIEEKNKIHVKTFESITEFLKRARDESLKTPEFAVPFALDTNKGYVELTHLIKYPKELVYRPQFLVKNTMPYDDFLKTINNSNMANDDARLMKIVRHLPDGSVQVLFETQDSEGPLEIRYLNDKDTRSSGSLDPVVDYQSESRIDTAYENNNAGLTDGYKEGFNPNNRNEAHREDLKSPVISDSSISNEYASPDLNLKTVSDQLGGNEELSQNSYFDNNSDTNSTSNSKPNTPESDSSWSSSLPNLYAKHPSPEFGKEIGAAVDSQVGAGMQPGLGAPIGSSTQMGLNTALNLGLKLNPMQATQLGSFFSKLIPSHSNAQATPNPSLNSLPHMNSHFDTPSGSAANSYSYLNSHSGSWSNPSLSLLSNTDSNKQEVGKNFSSSTQSIVLGWWKQWKSIIKGKIKQIIGKMANLAANIDRVGKP